MITPFAFFRERFLAMTDGRLTFEEAERHAAGHGEAARRWLPELVDELMGPVDLVARVLRSHEPFPEATICGRPDLCEPPAEQGMTVGSMICGLDERRLHACAGPSCEGSYRAFQT